jgi:hypothetical protein
MIDDQLGAYMVYKLVREYSAQLGFDIGAHALRATDTPTRSIIRWTSPRSRNSWGTPTSSPPASTITARRG